MENENLILREQIKKEWAKCYNDVVYFLKNYCVIQHQLRGKIKFDLFDFQEKTLLDLMKNDRNIILKSRQMGISTLVAGYALWIMNFHEDKSVLVIANKLKVSKNLVKKIAIMHEFLPTWLKEPLKSKSTMKLDFNNRSSVIAETSSPDSGRSESSALLIIDEMAMISDGLCREIWGAAQQTLATGGDCILLSTPKGVGNQFHEIWVEAENGENGFMFTKLPWYLHPERDQVWRDKQDRELGKRLAGQECDCDFLTSGHSVISAEILKWYESTIDPDGMPGDRYIRPPMEKRYNDSLWIWKHSLPNKTYLISADVARGDGSDYSAFHVWDIDKIEQVAEYKGKIGTTQYANLLYTIGTEYNDALLAVENANIGWAVLQMLIERGYKNLFYTSKSMETIDIGKMLKYELGNHENDVPGFTTSGKSRSLMIDNFERQMSNIVDPNNRIIVHSTRFINELYVFIWGINGKPIAMSGKNDDLVISAAIGLHIRDHAIRLRNTGVKMSKSMVTNISKGTSGIYTRKESDKLFKVRSGKEEIDIRDWI